MGVFRLKIGSSTYSYQTGIFTLGHKLEWNEGKIYNVIWVFTEMA